MGHYGTAETSDFKLLIVDDDEDVIFSVESFLKSKGYQTKSFLSSVDAVASVLKSPQDYDLIISDLKMPKLDGIELVEKIKAKSPSTPILLMTAHGSEETAIQAIQMGAFDYVHKPLHFEELLLLVGRALKLRQLEDANTLLQERLSSEDYFPEIIGRSLAVRELKEIIRKVGKSDASVLIQGESGCGKELVAKAIHMASPKKAAPFVALNCAAIPKELLESEMFGHVKGAFSGATSNREGVFQAANGGSLLLDEIGDMPIELQAKLLRVIQEKKIKPVGSDKEIAVEVRVLSASHQNLKAAVEGGAFREDLFFRLNVFPIVVPPLRERRDDIPILLQWFLRAKKNKKPLISEKALSKLLSYSWPGNVRELQNVAKRAEILAGEAKILEKHIILEFGEEVSKAPLANHPFESLPTLESIERSYIEHVLREVGGVKEKAAEILGIDRKTLYRKQKQFGIESK